MDIPRIDPAIRYITVGQMRRLDEEALKTTTHVVQQGDERITVVLPYGAFLAMQQQMDYQQRQIRDFEATRPVAPTGAQIGVSGTIPTHVRHA